MSEQNRDAINGALARTGLIDKMLEMDPEEAQEHPKIGEWRKEALLIWLWLTRFTSQELLQHILRFSTRSNLNRFLKKAKGAGIITYKEGNSAAKKLVLLTEKGWLKAEHSSYLDGKSRPFAEPNKVPLTHIAHDLIVQSVALDERLDKMAFENGLHRMRHKKPDALVRTFYETKAIEVETQPKSDPTAMLFKMQLMLGGDQEESGTGVDKVAIFCRAPGIANQLQAILDTGTAHFKGEGIRLQTSRYEIELLDKDDPIIEKQLKTMRAW